MKQVKNDKKLVNIAVLRDNRPLIRKLAEKSGLKVYALIDSAINLWAKTHGYEV